MNLKKRIQADKDYKIKHGNIMRKKWANKNIVNKFLLK